MITPAKAKQLNPGEMLKSRHDDTVVVILDAISHPPVLLTEILYSETFNRQNGTKLWIGSLSEWEIWPDSSISHEPGVNVTPDLVCKG